MNENLVWIIGIAVVVILVPVVTKMYRDWDYKRQIAGERPLRTLKEKERVPGEKPEQSPEMDSMVTQAKMDTVINLKRHSGPH